MATTSKSVGGQKVNQSNRVPVPASVGNERIVSEGSSTFYEGDEYDDYDDFSITASNGNHGGETKATKLNRRQDNRGGSGGNGTIYSAKHVRAKEALQQKGKH